MAAGRKKRKTKGNNHRRYHSKKKVCKKPYTGARKEESEIKKRLAATHIRRKYYDYFHRGEVIISRGSNGIFKSR